MTPPDTDIEKQKRRHGPTLYWLLAAVAVFLIGGLLLVTTPAGPESGVEAIPEATAE